MFDFLVDLLADLLDLLVDLLGDLLDFIGGLFSIGTAAAIAGGALLVSGVITVACLTYDSIQSELKRREDLKKKGVVAAVVTDFLAKSNGYEITLDALNNMNKSVGQIKMCGKSSSDNIRIGTRISLQ